MRYHSGLLVSCDNDGCSQYVSTPVAPKGMQIFMQWTASLKADNQDCWHTLPMPRPSSGYVQQQSRESRGCSVLLLLASYVPTEAVPN